jgi:hypothetical protein
MEAHASDLPALSGRAISAALGKSANHLWLILNRGMIPSGKAVLDIARVLNLSTEETDALVMKAVETKALVRSRDRFWITEAARIAERKAAEVARLRAFLKARGLLESYDRAAGEAAPASADRPSDAREGPVED